MGQFIEFIGFEPVPVFDYETAGGLMLDLLDKIPEVGDFVEFDGDGKHVKMTTAIMDSLRIDKIEVVIEAQHHEEDDEDARGRADKKDKKESHK